ncbi:MAG: hypothetical protein OHK0039_45140 [Bacteroidia bacterium]
MNRIHVMLFLALLVQGRLVHGQQRPARADFPYADRFSLVSGLTQVSLGGFNLEGTWYTRHLSFDYSHGVALKFEGNLLTAGQQDQQLGIVIPWTTGFGVGYRFTRFFDVRLEPKLHRYELYYADQQLAGTPLLRYTTATLGVGMYYRYYPFYKKDNPLQGIVIVPSARFGPMSGLRSTATPGRTKTASPVAPKRTKPPGRGYLAQAASL